MKRIYKRSLEPSRLKWYRERWPHETWDRFHRYDREGYRQIKQYLLEDQHYLCAYCEIDIKFVDSLTDKEGTIDDFRVEHYVAKSGTENSKHNYHLDWWNMLGVCHGGSQAKVVDPKRRYSKLRSDRTCDVPKSDKPISGEILNPLKIPKRQRLFCYAENSGKMLVDEKTCPANLLTKAENTIRELNLNAPRLMRMRKAVIDKLDEKVLEEQAAGRNFEEILRELAQMFLIPYDNRSLPFFSVMRWYFGKYAEELIAESQIL